MDQTRLKRKTLIVNNLEEDNDQTLASGMARDKYTQVRGGVSLSISPIFKSQMLQ